MLMPALSVTVVGALVAVGAIIIVCKPAKAAIVRAFVGAWLGFVAGAVPGLIADVLSGSGVYIAVLGHAGAAAGAVVAVRGRNVLRAQPTSG